MANFDHRIVMILIKKKSMMMYVEVCATNSSEIKIKFILRYRLFHDAIQNIAQ